ncbi:MAG TPA: hypothetical protein VN885_00455 [Candidatus Acidoferrales bacterium]|nr:hypothetical protein [Candidatus Acidoferrales bacterium]
MNEWAELDRALVVMASSGSTEVRHDGEWLAELATLQCEFPSDGKNSLVDPAVRSRQFDSAYHAEKAR